MFKNFFKTALRSLWKNKATSFINLFGLSVGMTAAVFIFLWAQNELSFDNYHPQKDNIYRITNAIQVSKEEAWRWESSPMPMAEAAKNEIPEVVNTARVIIRSWGGQVLNINHTLYSEKTSAYVDKTWLNMFHYDFVTGNATDFARDPFSIILTESKAKKYFGNTPAVGRLIKIDSLNYTVTGVIKDNPVNSSFRFDILLQMESRLADPKTLKNDKSWNNFGYITFLQLRPHASKKLVESKLNEIVNKNRTNHNDTVSLASLNNLYFENDLQSSDMPHGNKQTTWIFSLLGLLLLVTACINYVNLTTAKASLRAKEVSIRKITGAQKAHLFLQFIAESLVMNLATLLITLLLIKLVLPVFNSLTESNFILPFTDPALWRVLLGTLLVTSVLNGIYPALLLSSFNPLNVFRGKSVLKLKDTAIRKGLVVFQFSLSMVLIIGSIVISRQLHFIQTTNPGYNVSQVISVQIPYKAYRNLKGDELTTFFAAMKQSFESQGSIDAVCSGGSEIVNVGGASSGNADWDGRDTAYNPTVAVLSADDGFQQMFQLQMKQGKWFAPGREDYHNYILNETAAAEFNMHQPIIGQRFTYGGDTGRVIGIVKDFHYKSMHEKIGPMVLSHNQGSDSYFFIKSRPGNISKTVKATEAVWNKFIPSEPFSYDFLDDSFATLYKADLQTARLIFIFSLIVIIIAALGLVGLTAFTIGQRAKEVGIRKVLGASVQQITTLLSKEFVLLVLVAIVIASPFAWWAMNNWLQNFAYRINISPWIFITAGILALAIALISVSAQAIKAAMANPVKSLRSE